MLCGFESVYNVVFMRKKWCNTHKEWICIGIKVHILEWKGDILQNICRFTQYYMNNLFSVDNKQNDNVVTDIVWNS